MEWERSAERKVAERKRSGERAESAAHSRSNLTFHGGAENAGLENAGVAKMQEWKTREWKMQESEKYGKRRFQKCVSDCTD